MNFSDFPISETISTIAGALIGWFTSGRLQAKGKEISNTAELIQLWKDANHDCRAELDAMKAEIKELREEAKAQITKVETDAAAERERSNDEISKLQQKVKVLENHIKKLETK